MNNFFKKILITGGEGLVGKSIRNVLLRNGVENYSIDVSLDIRHDINAENIKDIFNKFNPSLVFHAAAHPGGKSLIEPKKNTLVNTLGSLNIINFCLEKKIPLIFTSSSAVYGEQEKYKLDEKLKTNPGTIYGINKVAVEDYIKLLFSYHNIPFIIFRLFATYGSGHKPNTYQGIVNVMMSQMLKGREVVVKGSLDRKRDIIYCEDAAELIYECMNSELAWNRIINIGTGQALTITEIIKTIAKVVNKPFEELSLVETKGTVGDPLNNVADTSLLESITSYRCKFDLESALMKMIRKKS